MLTEQVKRVVVKIGTSSLTHTTGKINLRRIDYLAQCLSDLKNRGMDIVLVSSGAIGVGAGKLGLAERPQSTREKQAVAAIGQCELMFLYDKFFGEYGQTVAQVLLTKDVVEKKNRNENVINTFEQLFSYGAIPIVNENDTVSVEEIEFGDNDTLSAEVANLVGADLLILMTDIDGLYDSDPRKNPHAKRIEIVREITPEIKTLAGGVGSRFGTGGMATKVLAAELATEHGCDMMVVDGSDPRILYRIFEGESVGTLFLKKEEA